MPSAVYASTAGTTVSRHVEGVEPEREHAGRPARRGQLHLRAAPGIGKILAVFGDENAFCIISKKSVMFESNL